MLDYAQQWVGLSPMASIGALACYVAFASMIDVACASAAQFLQQGDAALANGDLSAAVRHYTSAVDAGAYV